MLGLYRDNGKENGNYYSIIAYILFNVGIVLETGTPGVRRL